MTRPGRESRSAPAVRTGQKEEGTEVIQELSTPNKVVGAKQVRRALKDGRAARLYIAQDADPRLLQPLVQEAVRQQVPVEQVPTMKQLGDRLRHRRGKRGGRPVAVTPPDLSDFSKIWNKTSGSC